MNVDQKIAAEVYRMLQERSNQGRWNEYSSLAMKLPDIIQNNGMIPAVSFLKKKDDRLLSDLRQIVASTRGQEVINNDEFLSSLYSLDTFQLLLETEFLIKVAGWLKRMVEVLGGEEEAQPEPQEPSTSSGGSLNP